MCKTGSSDGSPILEINQSAFRGNRQGELSGRFSCFVPPEEPGATQDARRPAASAGAILDKKVSHV